MMEEDQFERLLDGRGGVVVVRNAAIAALAGSGVVVASIRKIRLADAEAALRGCRIFGRKPGPRALAALEAYLERRPQLGGEKRAECFLSPGGKPLRGVYVGRAIQRALERVGIFGKKVRDVLVRAFAAYDVRGKTPPPRPRARRKPVEPEADDRVADFELFEPALDAPFLEAPVVLDPHEEHFLAPPHVARKKPSRVVKKGRRRKARVRACILSLKQAANGCKDCGGLRDQPHLLTFDHLPQFKKRFEVGKAGSVDAVRAEAAKCELVCVECHRLREKRRGR